MNPWRNRQSLEMQWCCISYGFSVMVLSVNLPGDKVISVNLLTLSTSTEKMLSSELFLLGKKLLLKFFELQCKWKQLKTMVREYFVPHSPLIVYIQRSSELLPKGIST